MTVFVTTPAIRHAARKLSLMHTNKSNCFLLRRAVLFTPITNQARGHQKIFNIKAKVLEVGSGQKLVSYSDIFTKNGFKLVKNRTVANFKTAKFYPEQYFTKTVITDNLKNTTSPMAQDKIFTTGSKLFGSVMASTSVIIKKGKTYNQSRSKTDTVKTFGKECGKSLIAWEAGKLGLMFGSLLLPVGIISVISRIAFAGLASALAYKALEKIIG